MVFVSLELFIIVSQWWSANPILIRIMMSPPIKSPRTIHCFGNFLWKKQKPYKVFPQKMNSNMPLLITLSVLFIYNQNRSFYYFSFQRIRTFYYPLFILPIKNQKYDFICFSNVKTIYGRQRFIRAVLTFLPLLPLQEDYWLILEI